MPAKLNAKFRSILADTKRSAVVDSLRASPDTTLGELEKLPADLRRILKTVTIAEIMAGGSAEEPSPSTRGRGRSKRVVDTRSRTGRRAYEAAVLETLGGADGPLSAQEIRGVVGGTPLQARTALNRLIEDGKVSWEGKARATRYRVA